MVGVAISASLLPPAVNAGCLWALSLVTLIRGHDKVIIGWSFNHTYANEKDEIHFFYPAIPWETIPATNHSTNNHSTTFHHSANLSTIPAIPWDGTETTETTQWATETFLLGMSALFGL